MNKPRLQRDSNGYYYRDPVTGKYLQDDGSGKCCKCGPWIQATKCNSTPSGLYFRVADLKSSIGLATYNADGTSATSDGYDNYYQFHFPKAGLADGIPGIDHCFYVSVLNKPDQWITTLPEGANVIAVDDTDSLNQEIVSEGERFVDGCNNLCYCQTCSNCANGRPCSITATFSGTNLLDYCAQAYTFLGTAYTVTGSLNGSFDLPMIPFFPGGNPVPYACWYTKTFTGDECPLTLNLYGNTSLCGSTPLTQKTMTILAYPQGDDSTGISWYVEIVMNTGFPGITVFVTNTGGTDCCNPSGIVLQNYYQNYSTMGIGPTNFVWGGQVKLTTTAGDVYEGYTCQEYSSSSSSQSSNDITSQSSSESSRNTSSSSSSSSQSSASSSSTPSSASSLSGELANVCHYDDLPAEFYATISGFASPCDYLNGTYHFTLYGTTYYDDSGNLYAACLEGHWNIYYFYDYCAVFDSVGDETDYQLGWRADAPNTVNTTWTPISAPCTGYCDYSTTTVTIDVALSSSSSPSSGYDIYSSSSESSQSTEVVFSSSSSSLSSSSSSQSSVVDSSSGEACVYTPTDNFGSYYGGLNLAYLNDGSRTNGTIWGSMSPGNTIEVTLTFADPVWLKTLAVTYGQFNGNYNIPSSFKMFRGDNTGEVILDVTPSYSDHFYDVSPSAMGDVYTIQLVCGPDGYISIMELDAVCGSGEMMRRSMPTGEFYPTLQRHLDSLLAAQVGTPEHRTAMDVYTTYHGFIQQWQADQRAPQRRRLARPPVARTTTAQPKKGCKCSRATRPPRV